MALGAEFRNNVGQAHHQYSARESGADTPVVCDAMCAVVVDVFEIGISLLKDVREVLKMLDLVVLRLRPRRSIHNRRLRRIRCLQCDQLQSSMNMLNKLTSEL